jgi:hypothetical protein
VALAALTLTYFIGLLLKTGGAEESSVHAFGAILIALVASVVLAAVLLLYIASKAGSETIEHAKHGHGHGNLHEPLLDAPQHGQGSGDGAGAGAAVQELAHDGSSRHV